ncbi:putative glycosyl transferase [Pseudonocardia sp. Ae168_Ps1]|nr:putative glycosyl transferase [Pseudonocardia sp. Ae168_Ps1]OLL77497.1 putative glycosyl transferase [Pseudonocardia sp. Ae150A_Ps1]OLL88389.1 putative glycosyl transferase [Pseudonocardia sp. Ae263_Ps1]OLL91587.1 putative glycosyl transferase [Pseudonocardia sp. Ae356_Ps1]
MPIVRNRDVLVTVITPAYNVGPWIGESIDSVLAQTESRFEYLIVDDGSTDDTAEIVRARAERDPRIRLLQVENGGSGAARNRALAESAAPFVAFLDGDDRWHPQFLRHMLETMYTAPPGVGMAYCHTRVMLESGQVVALRWQPSGVVDIDKQLVENNPPHNGSSLMIRRACFDQVGGFDSSLPSAVDFEMWLRIAAGSNYPLMWGTRRFLLDMRLMRAGSISSNRQRRFECLDKVIAEYAPSMRRKHPGLAYIRPAVFAYRDGLDDFGDRWSLLAREAGAKELARDSWGRSLLAWSSAGRERRAQLRNLRDGARSGAYKGMSGALRTAGRINSMRG